MSFAALAAQGKKAAAAQRVYGYVPPKRPLPKRLTDAEKYAVIREHARGASVNHLRCVYKVSHEEIQDALS